MCFKATLLKSSSFIVGVLCLFVTLAYGLVNPAATFGDSGDMVVVSETVEGLFPEAIRFELEATSQTPIEEIRVFLKPVGSERSTYGYLNIVPGKEVKGSYEMLTGRGGNYMPPGTVIRYSFEIRDSGGQTILTDENEFLYLDGSLDWDEISEGILTVYYYGEFVQNRAREVLAAAQRTINDMGLVLGVIPDQPIRIVSYSNYRDMARALPFRSQAVTEGLKTEGMAWPVERVVLVLSSDQNFIGVASHELTHILVADATASGYLNVPAWLNEGLAEFGNQDPTEGYDRALAYGIYTRRVKPLWYLTNFSGKPEDITIAYGQGRSVVRYMIGAHGPQKMSQLMGAINSGLGIDAALKSAYGLDQYGLDSEWRTWLGLPHLPPPDQLELEQELFMGQDSESPAESQDGNEASGQTREPTVLLTPLDPPDQPNEGVVGSSSGGCSNSAGVSGSMPIQMGMIAIAGGPLLFFPIAFSFRRIVRRRVS